MNIDIFTCLAPNSAPYADKLIENLEQLKSGQHNIRYWALISSADINPFTLPKHWAINPVVTKNIPPTIEPPQAASVRHAKLLNSIPKFIPSDSSVTIIVDCDMYVMFSKWDEYVLYMLQVTDCFGTPKHDQVLHMYFLAMKTPDYKKANFNFMPGESGGDYVCRWSKVTGERAKSMGVVKGASIVTDTGWRISDSLTEHQLSYRKLNYVPVLNHAVPYRYYTVDDTARLFCAHLGGSHKREFKSVETQNWYSKCETLINK